MTAAIRWHHASLTVAAIDPAIAFFSAVFGFTPLFIERDMRDDIIALTGQAGLSCDFTQMRSDAYPLILELIAFHSSAEPRPEADSLPWRPGVGHVAFHVDDFDGVVALAVDHGASVLGRAIDFPGGRSIYCRAPGGAFFEIEHLDMVAM
ncbi:VOC family protein [Mesorhizobium sp. BR1-1-16]|uniref:VOC family protein n=1 Tax=Mesorhizobium sp. BR1-1-16 TaxID=2876653 RepID=UPI001CC939D8|nr:VOC family protein [Mesorhizobium sp. BR1-1-16]MBZ9935713.1 VOC family protein [Mesorhizobium sp. BR1-1-16]